MDVRQQRVEFVVAAGRKEKSFSRLCEEFEISRPTGYLWCKRYQGSGLEGIAEQSRKPQRSPSKTAESVEQQVMELRRRYPDWGARKLALRLGEQAGLQMPASTVHRILRRHKLVQPCEQHHGKWKRFERSRPNELWQMDFKGPRGWNQPVGPLAILDDHSRYMIGLQALGSTQAGRVREQLEQAFQDCGVPEGMLMDHGIPWWGPRAALGLTALSVWLMGQGIRLHWSGVRHPQTQGKIERCQGTLLRALEKRAVPEEEKNQKWLDDYRWEYNHVRPHQALGMITPAKVWTPSTRKYDPHPADWQYPPGAVLRKVDVDGKLQLDGRQWHLSRALRRQWVQVVWVQQRVLVYYCNSVVRELDPFANKSVLVNRWIR
jgi:transposase InsO family protein